MRPETRAHMEPFSSRVRESLQSPERYEISTSSAVFQYRIGSCRPFVVESGMSDWKAMQWLSTTSDGAAHASNRMCMNLPLGKDITISTLSSNSVSFSGKSQFRRHVDQSFREFTKNLLRAHAMACESNADSRGCADSNGPCDNLYLCQCPMFTAAPEDPVQEQLLSHLLPDVNVPGFVPAHLITDINLWISIQPTHSSLHYDEKHNLLCVVHGCKSVVLMPPSSTRSFSVSSCLNADSNHSDIKNLSQVLDSMSASMLSSCYIVDLLPGEMLFIPEGWWHSVASASCTVAVNVWWKGLMLSAPDEMKPFYARILLRSMVEAEMERRIHQTINGSSVVQPSAASFSPSDVAMHDSESLLPLIPSSSVESDSSSSSSSCASSFLMQDLLSDLCDGLLSDEETLLFLSSSAASQQHNAVHAGFLHLGSHGIRRLFSCSDTKSRDRIRDLMNSIDPLCASLLLDLFERLPIEGASEVEVKTNKLFFDGLFSLFPNSEALPALLLQRKAQFMKQIARDLLEQVYGITF